MENNIEEQNQTISITSLLLMLKRGWKLLLGVTIVILADRKSTRLNSSH